MSTYTLIHRCINLDDPLSTHNDSKSVTKAIRAECRQVGDHIIDRLFVKVLIDSEHNRVLTVKAIDFL